MAAPVVLFQVAAAQASRSFALGYHGDLWRIGIIYYFEYTKYLCHVRHSALSGGGGATDERLNQSGE